MTDGILATIGNTPLVALRRILPDAPFRLYAKLEALNPGGSIKDRAALNLLRGAMRAGRLDHDSVVVESSSGNMGIGLAQACAVLGVRFICVVDARTTAQNIAILRAYGAEGIVARGVGISREDPEPPSIAMNGGKLEPRRRQKRAIRKHDPRTCRCRQRRPPRTASGRCAHRRVQRDRVRRRRGSLRQV